MTATQKTQTYRYNQAAVNPESLLSSLPVTLSTTPLTLKKGNEKFSTAVDVKSDSHRLIQHKKSVADYNALLAEITNANIVYHTLPFPDTAQPLLVPKGTPIIFSVVDRQGDLKCQANIQRTSIPTFKLVSVTMLYQNTAICPNHCPFLHSPLTITLWFLRLYCFLPFTNLDKFLVIYMLTGHFSTKY